MSMTSSTPDAHLHLHGRRKSRSRKIRAGSPGEETALVEHLRSLSLANGTLEEIRKLLHMLILVGHGFIAEKLQLVTMQYQSVQEAAIKQIDEKISEEAIDNAIKVNKASKLKNLERHWQWVALGAPVKGD